MPTLSALETAQTSFDGYIRMTFEAFTRLKFTLREFWEDSDLHDDLRYEGIETSSAGYCEWTTEATRAISIGWAWFARPDGSVAIAPGGIGTNVMLVAPKTGYDLGQAKTGDLLRAWLNDEHWQPEGRASKLIKECLFS